MPVGAGQQVLQPVGEHAARALGVGVGPAAEPAGSAGVVETGARAGSADPGAVLGDSDERLVPAAYNAQAVVDGAYQVITAADVTTTPRRR